MKKLNLSRIAHHTKLATLQAMIKDTKGRFFTVTFIKKDNTVRVMNCRLGVKVHLKGNGNNVPTSAGHDNLVTVYDTQAKGYRTINLDTVTNLKTQGLEITF